MAKVKLEDLEETHIAPRRWRWPGTARSLSQRKERLLVFLGSPDFVLAGMIAVYVLTFGRLTWAQQSNYGTFGFDMGIFDQGIWLLSRFKDPFITVRGLNIWGNHVNPNVLLLVPIYWLGGGPHALYLIETVVMALGAWPVWLMARERLGASWPALVVPMAYLLFPSLEWINWWHFHPEALAITPMLFAWWFARKRRWWLYAACIVLVASSKEDAALVLIALGVLVALYFSKKAGAVTAGSALAWFVIAIKVVQPAAAGGATPFYLNRFPAFGQTLGSIVYNLVRHPSRVLRLATRADRLSYYRMLLIPVAGLCLLSPAVLTALPAVVVNITSSFHYTRDIHYQYQALVIGGIFIGLTESCALLRARPGLRSGVMGLLAAAALAANVAWSPSPIGVKYHSGIWTTDNQERASLDHAVKLVPPNAGVSASYTIDSHMTHRVHIYEWPNPFKAANWGINDRHLDSTSNVEYLVLDTRINGDTKALLNRLLAPKGEFEVIYRQGPVLVAKRITG